MRALRVAGLALCGLVVLYWLAVAWAEPAGVGFKMLLALLGLVVLGFAIRLRTDHAMTSPSRSAALALAVFAPAGAFLLMRWIHDDLDRYVWIIRQLAPCTYMGGGPGALWVISSALVFAVGAASYALAGGISRRAVILGVVAGFSLATLTAAAMFPDPTVFARTLGCL